MEIDRWRQEFPSAQRMLHLNHAGVSPVSQRVVRAVRACVDDATMVAPATAQSMPMRTNDVRTWCADLIGAAAHEIAFITNTSEGLSLVASAITWRDGDNVVAIDGDYPANVYPWWGQRRFGVKTRMVTPRARRFGVDDVRAASDARTRVVAVSAVDWQTGFRCDLRALGAFCRARGILFCVDGIQAVGALRIDVERDLIDCLAFGGHKWLLAPPGCGALYVAQRVVEQLQPVILGWKSVTDAEAHLPYHFDLRRDAMRFEPGTTATLGIAGLGAAVRLLHEVGATAIESRILDLTAQLAEGLRRRGAEVISPWADSERSGILTVRLDRDPAAVVAALENQSVLCRVRTGGLRLAPHFYLADDDVARFFAVFDDVTSG
ncbi:MAG TPA: aminotransferase class V-fold PLP-dependent enzyme [Candidatus Binatia bacterium]|nr:aminotransferase class V-fold PLP-dependent enzyme [Candidatus Binatia bacterium]